MGVYSNAGNWPAAFIITRVWNSADTGNVPIFKVVKNFSCGTVVVSFVLLVCKIAHKRFTRLAHISFPLGVHVRPPCRFAFFTHLERIIRLGKRKKKKREKLLGCFIHFRWFLLVHSVFIQCCSKTKKHFLVLVTVPYCQKTSRCIRPKERTLFFQKSRTITFSSFISR